MKNGCSLNTKVYKKTDRFEPVTSAIPVNLLPSLPMCGFTAQLVEHRTGIAEVTGSNPVEAQIFFRLLPSNCLNWKIYCDDHSSLSFMLLLAASEHAEKNPLEIKLSKRYCRVVQHYCLGQAPTNFHFAECQ